MPRRHRLRSWAYDVYVAGRLSVRTYGEEQPDNGTANRFLRTWLEYRSEDWGIRLPPRRVHAGLRCDRTLRPLEYRVFTEDGAQRLALELRASGYAATYADGTVLEGDPGEFDFLLGANNIPHLAAKVAELAAAKAWPYRGAFLSPESLESIPYTLDLRSSGVVSNLGERLEIDASGLVSLAQPELGIEARPVQRTRPRWPPAGGQVAPPRSPRRRSYRPPPEVSLTEGTTDSPSGTPIGYTVASGAGPPLCVALFCGGSGSHDRHGFTDDVDLGYHDLLDGLATSGVTSVRFDKRGAGGTPIGADILSHGFEGIVADATACLGVAAAVAAARRVPLVVVGHSEGGLVALRLANAHLDVGAIVLLATAATPLDDVIASQVRARGAELSLPRDVVEHQVADLREFFEHVRRSPYEQWEPETVPPRVFAQRRLARYYSEALASDPLDLVRRVRCPLLIVHGEEDQQVSPEDARALERAALGAGVDVELFLVPGANHLLKSSGRPPSIADYLDGRRRIKPAVRQRIARWIADKVVERSV